ncbi:ATP-grasp domain-containing protein [Streptomyces sp. NPDC058171]
MTQAARRHANPNDGSPGRWFAFLESNTTGTGREFCATARARGLRPVLLTRDPGRYPYVAQDDVDTRLLDTSDLSAVLDTCAALAADGGLAAIASSSEYFVSAAARAAAAFGLPGPDGEAVARCRDKEVQRRALAAGGVAVPAFRAVDQVTGAVRAADAIGHPVVLKPVSGSGSVGVRLCRDRAATEQWAGELLGPVTHERGNAVPTRILVEAAVAGPEFSVETIGGDVVAIVAKHLGPEPHFVETGHDVPAPVPDATAAALGATALKALAALGLGWGAAHTELRLTPEGPVVIEVNPRLAGGMIPVAVRAAAGVDLVDTVVALAAGQDPAPEGAGAGHAAVRFLLAAREGRITAVDGVEVAATAPGVVAVTTSTAAGRTVRLTHSFQDRLSCVVATGCDAERAARHAMDAVRLIDVRWEGPVDSQEPVVPEAYAAREGVGGR